MPNTWIKWSGYAGAKCPVCEDELVQVRFMEGHGIRTFRAGDLYWWLPDNLPTGIVEYRVYAG